MNGKAKRCVFAAAVLLVAASFSNMACSPRKGVYPAAHYESDEIAYYLPAVNAMKCPIEPYILAVPMMYSGKQTPIEGAAYHERSLPWCNSLMPRVCKIFKHGVLVAVGEYRAFILTDRHYSFNDELEPGYYIYGGYAVCKDGYSSIRKAEFRAFREMDSAVVRKRGLDLD